MNTTVTILSSPRKYTFTAKIHTITDPDKLFLDGKDFYRINGGEIPTMPHHEIEIIRAKKNFFNRCILHVSREPKKNRLFVCYPRRMATVEKATDIFRMWCAGSVCTFEGGPDLNKLFKGNFGEFYLLMKNTYHIVVDGTSGRD